MGTYLPRIVDGELERSLRSVGAVRIEGPKACGKTATANRIISNGSYAYLREDGVHVIPIGCLGP